MELHQEGKKGQNNAISPFFDASGNKNIGATIRIGQEIPCLPYAGFLLDMFLIFFSLGEETIQKTGDTESLSMCQY